MKGINSTALLLGKAKGGKEKVPFQIGDSKILWPKEQYELIRFEFGEGTGWYKNDLLDIAERAGILDVDEESVLYNELLAGELGIDLLDVSAAIIEKVEREHLWTSFEDYKRLRAETILTWNEFIDHFQIGIAS